MLLSLNSLLLLLQASVVYGTTIQVANGGTWGNWGVIQTCPSGTKARGFRLKVQSPLIQDNTALNGIELSCATPLSFNASAVITSSVGGWGSWGSVQWCPAGKSLQKFSLQVQQPVVFFQDDTAANNIKFQCSDSTVLTGIGGSWGSYGSWSGSCLSGICGISTRVQPNQGAGDDTALNDVKFLC